MCGSIAIVALQQHKHHYTPKPISDLSARLENGLSAIQHRGPDSQALGHNRLSINDLTPAGHQPLHNEKQTVHAVVNGEIYDYDRLRTEMVEKEDYQFQGRSDCELVLALYQCYGTAFVSHLRGEFALCLYDAERELFLAVRDRYGIKPLFWTVLDRELLVAAEMKALRPLGWEPEWNVKAIVDGSFQIGQTTIFKDVQKVQPGHMLISRHFGPVQEQQYWDMEFPNKMIREIRSETEMIEGVRSRLLDAIRLRLRADVKVGIALSGGIDSSAVAGMVNHLLRQGEKIGGDAITERLSCFGIAFDEDSGFDESATANRTAKYLGVKFHKKYMDEQALADYFDDATWVCEQPNPDLNFIGLYALSDLVREQGFRVILNGQGSDEIFAGYNIFLADYLREPDTAFPVPNLPPNILAAEAKKAHAALRTQFSIPSAPASPLAYRLLGSTLAPTLMTRAFPSLPIHPSLLPPHPTKHPTAQNAYVEAISPPILYQMSSQWQPLHTALYTFTKTHLDNLILSNLGDRGEMAHSIEGRTPFLDHHLTQYVNGLPPSMKIRAMVGESTEGGMGEEVQYVEKYVLREAVRPFVTNEIYAKRKHPYSAPLRYPVNGPLHRLMKRVVTRENVEGLGFLLWKCESVNGGGDGKELGRGDGREEGVGVVEGRTLGELVDIAFTEGDKEVFKLVICVAQWVVLGKRFGVRKTVVGEKGVVA